MKGVYYNSTHSKRQICTLYMGDNLQVLLEGVNMDFARLSDISVSPRIGNSTRFITFPDGGVFETEDNDAVDSLLSRTSQKHSWFKPYQWESSKKLIVFSVVSLLGITYLLVEFGIPAISRNLAYSLPSSISVTLANEVLATLDGEALGPSTLSAQRKQELSEQFDELTRDITGFELKLKFREGGILIGANAFALPDGVVVLTDQLIALAENDLELLSVMLHEVGHVVHRHSLRQLIESSGLAALLVWITGDIEAANSWIIALPAILIQSSYSRDAEWEADGYALEHMLGTNISPRYFADLMEKLHAQGRIPKSTKSRDDNIPSDTPSTPNVDIGAGEVENDNAERDAHGNNWMDYLSSHPATEDRIKRFKDAARQIASEP